MRSCDLGPAGFFHPAPSAQLRAPLILSHEHLPGFSVASLHRWVLCDIDRLEACAVLFPRWKAFPKPGQACEPGQRFYSAEETPSLHAPPSPYIPHSIAALHVFNFPLQLTETSSRYARKISGTTALQEALKEKQQHIEQLLAERDLERAEVAKATSHVGEIEQELALARDGHDQVKSGPDLVVEMVMGSRLILSRRR